MRAHHRLPFTAALLLATAAALAAPGDREPSSAALEGTWVAGDCHAHVRPGDQDGHIWATIDTTVAAARLEGVRWMILTPHFWRGRANEDGRVAALARFHDDVGARNRAAATAGDRGAPLLIPGLEETRQDPGHLGLSFLDLREAWAGRDAHGGSLALEARARGAFLVLNHPYGQIVADMSWKPWTSGREPGDEARAITERADAIEVYNGMMATGERLLRRPRERWQSERAIAAIDRAGLAGRRLVGVGGSDDHQTVFFKATTWALVRGPLTEGSLLEALRAGRVVCGASPAASSFWGASDRHPDLVPPGAAIEADREVRLRWTGRAELWRDGVSLGERNGGLTDAIEPGTRHVYRIVVSSRAGPSYANPIFVNLAQRAGARAKTEAF